MHFSRLTKFATGASLAFMLGSVAHAASVKQITGAGSSFAYPLYSAWADQYAKQTGVQLNYQSIGSGGGIRAIKSRTVDFGATDAPLKEKDLKKHSLVQFPTAMGGVIPTINVPGVKPGQMVLSGPVLADIFMGKITQWNAPAIKQLNPGLNLPNMRITVVHRSDGSGTTFIFTNYLAKVSPAWKKEVGFGKAVNWPSSGNVGGKGNEGVAAYVNRIRGSIGYNEYAYVTQNHMNYADMINRAGQRVAPTAANFASAAANADWKHAPGYYLMLTDQPGAKSWPITGATFLLVPAKPAQPERTKAVLKFFDWGYTQGRSIAEKLDYIPMPESVVKMIEATWHQDIHPTIWK
ncbi:phosphate ABC transporter substrate-binding protein PstS [Acidihalobacter ferrooxydans]|uniref:Phosphate-binding protein PstS n=1 Tax=Acidihalobacter ferrooxydans TaxID=1765967 RepID=A0A1P8UL74_9GAMM|nr:phosphate ABC transporter substrate-binding protein PstS [Acidihalobacter ferrooxydans]APZ44565.1 phosphate ABC transporter substrate-binding protein PstS [Acidihalobacter ferrooxydans]